MKRTSRQRKNMIKGEKCFFKDQQMVSQVLLKVECVFRITTWS